jgi:hypothetical protein
MPDSSEDNGNVERRYFRERPSRSGMGGRRSTDSVGQGHITVTKVTLVILVFLVDVVCLAGDALLLRSSCL